MRIVHVTDCYPPRLGGIERQVQQLAVRQRDSGHEVHVVTSVPGPDHDEYGIPVFRSPARRGTVATNMRWEWSRRGRDHALSGQFDVVHVHASTFSPLAVATAAAAGRAGVAVAVTAHSLWSYTAPLYRLGEQTFAWTAWPVAWSAVSRVATRQLQEILPETTPVLVLPNGIDPQEWRPRAPRQSDPGRVVIASVGRLSERKRPRQLLRMLRATRELVPDHIRIDAVIAGDGPQRHRMQRYLERAAMTDWVRLPGRVGPKDVRDIMHRADIYVAPATLESFGIAALEARCAGLPVVAHSASGIGDFVEDEVHGLLASGDAHMVHAMARLCRSVELRERIRTHNVGTAPPISWGGVLEACDTLYARAYAATGRVEGPRSGVGA